MQLTTLSGCFLDGCVPSTPYYYTAQCPSVLFTFPLKPPHCILLCGLACSSRLCPFTPSHCIPLTALNSFAFYSRLCSPLFTRFHCISLPALIGTEFSSRLCPFIYTISLTHSIPPMRFTGVAFWSSLCSLTPSNCIPPQCAQWLSVFFTVVHTKFPYLHPRSL